MPLFQLEPYRNPYTTSLATLVGAGDRARAEAMQTAGRDIAQGAQQAGQEVGATLNNIGTYMREAPQREAQQIQLTQLRRSAQDDQDARAAFQQAKGDPAAAIDLLEKKGNYKVAMSLRAQMSEATLKALEASEKNIDIVHKRITDASGLLQGVMDDPDPAGAYARALPTIRNMVGPQLAPTFPDAFDPNVVKQQITQGMTAAQVTQRRGEAAREARETMLSSVTKIDLADKLTKLVAKDALTVQNQDDWDKELALVKHLGGDQADDVIGQFGTTFDAGAIQTKAKRILSAPKDTKYEQADVLATKDGKTVLTKAGYDPTRNLYFAPGDNETPLTNVRRIPPADQMQPGDRTEMVKALLKNPSIYNDLTETVKSNLWPDLNRAGFVPPAHRDTGQSAATAERWKAAAIQRLDKEYSDMKNDHDEEYDRRLNGIEASYLVQIGQPASSTPTPPPPAPAPSPTPAPHPTPTPTPAPAKLPAGLVPGAVVTLKNGTRVTVTKINADGTFEYK